MQTARASAPQVGAPFISAGDRPAPNEGTEVKLSGYSIRPSVYAAQQVFVVNWGEYDMTTELGDSWAPGTVGQVESSNWICSDQGGLATKNTHGQTTPKARTAAVHVANKAQEQMYYLEMEVSATIALDGVTAAQWIGRPQLVQDNKTWDVFFTGNTQAGVDFLSSYSWNDLFHDIGVGLNSLIAAFLGPVITIFVIVIVALFLIYAGPGTFKAIGKRVGGKR